MSQLDSELSALRIRLATLEEQKRIESEKKAFPLNTLEDIIVEKKQQIERNKMKVIHADDEPVKCPVCYGSYYPVNRTNHYKTDKHKRGIKIKASVYSAV